MRLLLALAILLACPATAAAGSFAGAPLRQDGLRLPARVQGDDLALAVGGRFSARFWPGVNLGATVPGHAPGELAPARADYDRWLKGIGALGARVVRVYTILRPASYDALAAYNHRHRGAPLYLIQGVWIPEEQFLATGDAYSAAVTAGFDREIADAVDVVHGDARLPARRGHASGRYRSDVSRWLLAWSPGIEWDPDATASTDARNAGRPPYAGRYVTATPDATPMESWIAARLDGLASLEARRGWSRPLTFTNWLTADPLRHPSEPLAQEDRVSIDAMHLHATGAWPGGFFASYHAYPYYPDFLRLEYAGAPDPYAAYLAALRAHHAGQAVMITEFGVPSGLGAAHRGPLGRDQGDHSELEAGALDAGLLAAIRRSGFAGGVLFEDVDEWFKRTWNTQAIAQPVDRRPLWHNVLTNETQFGIVAAEPDRRPRVTLDGRAREWGGRGRLQVTHDTAYLYLLVRRRGATTRVGFDVRPGGGEDVVLTLGPGRRATLRQAAATDPLPPLFGVAPQPGPWVSPRLLLSRPYTVPSTGEQRPAEFLDLGTLRWRNVRRDVRTLVAGDDRTAEVRIPWMLLGLADPSSHRAYDVRADGTVATPRVSAIALTLDGRPAGRYRWAGWNRVRWHERRKAGWSAVRRAFRAAG
jgi:hypothetical protein